MRFGRNHGRVEEEELYGVASRCSSLRQMADELGIPHGTFWRHLGREENREIRESIEGIVASRQTTGTGHEDRWWIEDDYYVFPIQTLEHPYRIHRGVWSEVVWSYSRAGGNLTKAEVAREFDIPRPYLERALALYGHLKASMPYLREEVGETEDVEGLAERTLERKEHDYYRHLQEKEIRRLRREVQAYREGEYRRREAMSALAEEFRALAGDLSRAPKWPAPRPTVREGWVAHLPLADVHAGLYVWGEELWAHNYDTDNACSRIIDHAEESAGWIERQGGCRVAWVADVGDLFHGLLNATERGTPLQQDTRARRVWRMTVDAKIRAVRTILEVVPEVKVVSTPGNHDHIFNFLFHEALDMHFSEDQRVEVITTVTPQSYFVVGSTMHLLLHGTKIGQLTSPKAKATVELIARNSAGRDYAKVNQIKAYVGHLHNSQTETQGAHLEMIRLPAAAETDDYAQSLGFFHQPGARLFRLDQTGDIEVEKRVRFR
jgi:hypothetical protein